MCGVPAMEWCRSSGHDGARYAAYAGLLVWVAAMVAVEVHAQHASAHALPWSRIAPLVGFIHWAVMLGSMIALSEPTRGVLPVVVAVVATVATPAVPALARTSLVHAYFGTWPSVRSAVPVRHAHPSHVGCSHHQPALFLQACRRWSSLPRCWW